MNAGCDYATVGRAIEIMNRAYTTGCDYANADRRNRTQHVSSINKQMTAKEYRSMQGLAKIL